jgi:hypothetical protein
MIEIFALLLFAHFLFDYPLQGDWLARAKNRSDPIPHVPWYQAMFAHTAMHGMAVWIITGIPLLGLAEMAIHWITDDLKLQGELTFNQDQAIHIVCKAVWAVITVLVVVI